MRRRRLTSRGGTKKFTVWRGSLCEKKKKEKTEGMEAYKKKYKFFVAKELFFKFLGAANVKNLSFQGQKWTFQTFLGAIYKIFKIKGVVFQNTKIIF